MKSAKKASARKASTPAKALDRMETDPLYAHITKELDKLPEPARSDLYRMIENLSDAVAEHEELYANCPTSDSEFFEDFQKKVIYASSTLVVAVNPPFSIRPARKQKARKRAS